MNGAAKTLSSFARARGDSRNILRHFGWNLRLFNGRLGVINLVDYLIGV